MNVNELYDVPLEEVLDAALAIGRGNELGEWFNQRIEDARSGEGRIDLSAIVFIIKDSLNCTRQESVSLLIYTIEEHRKRAGGDSDLLYI